MSEHCCGCGHDHCPVNEHKCCHDGCEHDDSCGCGCGHDHEHGAEAPFSRPLLWLGVVLAAVSFLPFWGSAALWLLGAAVLLIGYPLFFSGITGLLRDPFAMDELTLLTVAVAASLGLAVASADPFEGVFEAAAVTVLFRLGSALEARAVAKSRRDIEALTEIRPDNAALLDENDLPHSVPAASVPVGSRILLRAGDRVPIDCEVLSGGGNIDLSAITGEPIPVQAAPGTALPSGGIDLDGLLICRTTAAFEDSTASRIIRMVRESAAQKGQAERLISRFARIYTPAVILAAAALAVLPPLLGLGGFSVWLSRALVFLVASCPCALVISIPLTFFAGVGRASRQGVLVKGTRYLETLAAADCVVFDKTGTLTKGVPYVSECVAAEGADRGELIALAAAAEQHSSHPAAKAVLEYAGAVELPSCGELTEHPGMGVSLLCGGRRVLCGSDRLLAQHGVSTEGLPPASVYLAADGAVLGCFVLSDRPREEAREALDALRSLGIRTLGMLTGDGEAAAEAVKTALGLDTAAARLLPQDKAAKLAELRQVHRAVLFVGDGINDAPVLAAADAGVAMGLGTDAAIEAADVVLMRERLTALPDAVRTARRTVSKARQNIVFALTVKAAVLLLGALGYAGMWMAVFADVGVSILAVLNAVTLLIPVKSHK